MSSIKCANCGLVNFSHDETCKRCRATLQGGERGSPTPLVGAWRDRCWLVKQLSVPLIDRCIKCSESDDVAYTTVTVQAYSAWSLLTQLAGVRIFRMIPIDVPLCRRHRLGLDKLVVGIILAGLGLFVVGIALLQMNSLLPIVLFSAGILVIAAGLVIYLVRREVVKVWRYKDPYIWLWGVHRSYLEGLPKWSERQAR